MKNVINKIKEEISFEKVLTIAIKTPGVKINRSTFLHKELLKYCSEETIQKAIDGNPAKAGISKDIINN